MKKNMAKLRLNKSKGNCERGKMNIKIVPACNFSASGKYMKLAVVVLVLISVSNVTTVGAAHNNEQSSVRTPGEFDSYETMQQELEMMRQAYKPFLQGLPSPLNVRSQVPIFA